VKKIRVHELAKKLGISNNEMLEKLKELGVDVKSHLNSIEHQMAVIIIDRIRTDMHKTGQKEGFKPDGKVSKRALRRKAKHATLLEKPGEEDKPDVIKVREAIPLRKLADLIGENPGSIMKKLIQMGKMISINSLVEPELTTKVGELFDKKIEIVSFDKKIDKVDKKLIPKSKDLVSKAPVITIMGHVDHGKTSLLDAIRDSKITEKEKGGITQHIGAYKVKHKDSSIVFLDTPGHEAFTTMRARGAHVTDIVVLVVAADDGAMPQTIEAINHAKAAKVPIIVAINKIDKPGANPQKVMEELAKLNLMPEAWGGETIYVNISAKKRTGIQDLLEMIVLQAEILELKAQRSGDAKGVVLEAKLDKGRGPVATILIQQGELKAGKYFVAGVYNGRVRAMFNEYGEVLKKAPPSTPVEVLGFTGVPNAGDVFRVIPKGKIAKQIGNSRQTLQWEEELVKSTKMSIESITGELEEEKKELNIILKADVQGSIEAIVNSIMINAKEEEIDVNIIHKGVGAIIETDVMLASTSDAMIIGFNVRPVVKAQKLAQKENINIDLFTVIYELIESLTNILKGMQKPVVKEVEVGRVAVREIFHVPKIGTIAGSFVISGKVVRNYKARLTRDNIVVYDGKISSLKRFKEDVKEVQSGYECGVGLENFSDIKQDDIIEVYTNLEITNN